MLQIRLLNHITWQPIAEFSHRDVILDNDCTVHQECLAREDPSKVSCKYLLLKISVACVYSHQHCSFLIPIGLHFNLSLKMNLTPNFTAMVTAHGKTRSYVGEERTNG